MLHDYLFFRVAYEMTSQYEGLWFIDSTLDMAENALEKC